MTPAAFPPPDASQRRDTTTPVEPTPRRRRSRDGRYVATAGGVVAAAAIVGWLVADPGRSDAGDQPVEPTIESTAERNVSPSEALVPDGGHVRAFDERTDPDGDPRARPPGADDQDRPTARPAMPGQDPASASHGS